MTRRLAADGFTGARVAARLGGRPAPRGPGDRAHRATTTATTSREMAARFVAEYLKTYGYRDESPIELVKLRVVGRGLREQRLDFAHLHIEARAGAPAARSRAHPLRPRRGRQSTPRSCRAPPLSRRAPPRPAGDRGVRRHHRRAARRHRRTATPSATSSSTSEAAAMNSRSDHLRRHQERARLDRRRHGLHGRAHRPLGDRQGRDGLLGRAVRRRRADGGAGQDHRPASGRHPRGHGGGARQVRRRPPRRRRRHHERSLSRRHAPARHLHVHAAVLRGQAARLRRRHLPPHRRRRPRAGLQCVRLHRDLPGRPAHPAAQALRPRQAQRDAGGADQDQRARARPRLGRSLRAVRRRPGRQARAREAVRALRRRRGRGLHERAARLCRAADARRDQALAQGHATSSPTTSTATASPTRRSRSRSPSPCARTARCWSTTRAPARR